MTDHCDVQTFFWGFERSFCRCMAVMSCALGWCVCNLTCFQVMWLVVRWFVVLLRYYSVLQSTTPALLQYYSNVLLRTTKYYSSTTLYYKVLLQYYASTTLYYKVLLQYYSVLQSTTLYYPVLQRTTLYYKVLRQYYNVLLQYDCTTKYYSSTILYYKVIRQYYSVLQSTTPVLFCTTPVLQRTTPVLLWNVIYNAWSNKSHPPTLPNTAPATQNECHQWSASHMNHHFQCAQQAKSTWNLTKYCACHAKWMSSMICVTYETSFPMRGASKVTLQPHQMLRLPRKLNVINDLRHIWKLISKAWSKSSHPPTSPNTAPATQNECQEWFASHMKPHFQCVEPVKSPPNLTKYCTCHTKSMSSVICVTYETSFPMRGASQVTLQPHQILRLPRNLEAQDLRGKSLKCFRQ